MQALEHRKVLVLNTGWTPIHITSLKQAIVMLFTVYDNGNPKARVVDPTRDFQQFDWNEWSKLVPREGEGTIASTCDKFCIPEVILLTEYDKFPNHKVHFSRRQIYRRDSYECQYCGCRPGTEELSIDHVVPRSRGGETTWTNCVLSCVKCNSKKADHPLEQTSLKLRKQPKKPQFNLFRGDRKHIPTSWSNFISEAYWETEMDNDEG